MAKKIKINLDDLELEKKKGTLTKDEVIKVKNLKFSGGQSKLPSLIARGMAESMLKDLDTGTYIDASGFDVDKRKLVIASFKKDFTRIAKAAERTDLRIRAVDQGTKISFYFDKKKSKKDGVKITEPKKEKKSKK